MKKLLLAFWVIPLLLPCAAQAQLSVSTVTTTGLSEPYNVAEDTKYNIYITDSANNRIVKMTGTNQFTLAGTGGSGSNDGPASGPGNLAQFNNPQGLLPVTIAGTNGLLVADTGNNLIRFVRLSDGYVTTLAGQAGVSGSSDNTVGTNALFYTPIGLTQDSNGNVYISDYQSSKIRVMNLNDPNFGVATMNLTGTILYRPTAIANGGASQLWVADTGNNTIKLFTLNSITNASLTTYMGSNDRRTPGTADSLYGPSSRFNIPSGLLWIPGFGLLISDTGNNSIRLAISNTTPGYGSTNYEVATFAGTPGTSGIANGSFQSSTFWSPVGLCLDPTYGAFLVADLKNNTIRRILTGLPPPPPSAPVILTVTTNYGLVNLTWSMASSATNYNVKRSGTAGTEILISSTTGTSYSDTNVLNGATYFYVVSASNAGGEGPNSAEVRATPPLPPVPNPQIGYVDFPATSTPIAYTSVFHPVSSFVFNNDALILISGAAGSQTYYTFGATSTNGIPDPTSASSSAPSGYQDGQSQSQAALYSINPQLPDVTIKAIGEKIDGSPNSAIVQARFQFVTANPSITGDNAGQFTISDLTANAHLFYTIDGSDPSSTNGVDLGTVATQTNLWTVGFTIQTNTLFKVRAFRANYQPSGIVSTSFSASNFVANVISFGFVSGEASSDFVASPGQVFYAPVTLSLLPGVSMYTLQFNIIVTNLGAIAVGSGQFDFSSMLMKPIPELPGAYEPIPPYSFISSATPTVTTNVILYNNGFFQNLQFTNTSINLLGIGWLERYSATNLYNTKSQNLVTYSIAHDVLYSGAAGKIEVGGYGFQVPITATSNDVYQIQIGRPSASADGIGVAGSDVYIASPTNGAVGGGSPLNALKHVTIGQRKYLAGGVYPFRWFNAGDFGTTNLVSDDVEQVFQSAVYFLNTPPYKTDFYDAMDSCGNYGVLDTDPADANNGNYTNAATFPAPFPVSVTNYTYTIDTNGAVISTNLNVVSVTSPVYLTTYFINVIYTNTYIQLATPPAVPATNISLASYTLSITPALSTLFDANNTAINQIAFGDGVLDVCDVYVTFRRSLDPTLTWYRRFWNNGQRVADTGAPNVAAHFAVKTLASSTTQPMAHPLNQPAASTLPPQVVFNAATVSGSAGQVVQVPITATIFGSYPLRVLMLNLTVVPLDGSPALTNAVQFTPNSALGAPYTTGSQGNGNYSGVWLDSTIAGLTGTATLGTLTVTLPAGATASAAYAVHFDHASASPNGLASFPKQTLTGLVTLSARTNSSYGDGIPDSWRLRWFGTVNNLLSVSNACPSGDGISNYKKYVAGVDPSVANNFPSTNPVRPARPGSTMAIHWPTVFNKQYVIERSSSLFSGPWTTISTNTGTGADMEYDDQTAGAANFYRVRILP